MTDEEEAAGANETSDISPKSSSNIDSSLVRRDAAREDGSASSPRRWDVFISYRIEPDQVRADALKTLVEKSISPTPNVFVAGNGGIMPSHEFFGTQIQGAAYEARAFVGIITSDSLEREWVIFEAGAAFGRRALYTPLLFGVEPKDLPSVISSYQAIRAPEKEEMRRLIEALAHKLDATANFHGASHNAFLKSCGLGQTETTDEPPIWEAAEREAKEGSRSKALELYADAIGKCDTDEDFAKVLYSRLLHAEDSAGSRGALLRHNTKRLRDSEFGRLLLQVFSPDTLLQKEMYELDVLKSSQPELARGDLATFCFRHGEVDVATCHWREMLSSENPDAWKVSATQLAQFELEIIPCERLLLLVVAVALGPPTSASSFVEFLRKHQFFVLLLDVLRSVRHGRDESTTEIDLGRAYHALELRSLAWEQYGRANGHGANVGLANRAVLLNSDSCAAAGLEQLLAADSPIQASDNAFPFRLRADLEASVQSERKRLGDYERVARKQMHILTTYALDGLRRHSEVLDAEEVVVALGTRKQSLIPASFFPGLRVAKSETHFVCSFDSPGREMKVLIIAPDGTAEFEICQLVEDSD